MAMCLAFVVLIISLSSALANPTTNLHECSANEDCDPERACKENTCVNPCATLCGGANTLCLTTDHMAMCACRPGYSGHPLTGCIPNSEPDARDTTLTILRSKMSEEMQIYAVETATQALKDPAFTTFAQMARQIKKMFHQKYNQRWHVIVGREINLYYGGTNYINFKLGKTPFLIWRRTGFISKDK